ncbi:NADH dehydrogenase [ubiquinone] 1 subunit C2 [Aethina tumida]|uniref:NADH dehydrogenase [ubiquinone] 1 subunit C2 n=1 Tax=Aethina tumida TaxID=116153 RepID=UPI00096ADB1D|nr:NADH dehydrogenase [ubiquinone] 1 subunit C2 [Aethina tumida]
MATGPGLPKNALELLSNPCKVEKPLTAKYWGPAACAVVGFTSVIIGNYLTRRPVFSGIHRHALFGGGGLALGFWLDDVRNRYLADRDAVYRHYIELHPEDFPDYDRKKIGELFLPWVPVR